GTLPGTRASPRSRSPAARREVRARRRWWWRTAAAAARPASARPCRTPRAPTVRARPRLVACCWPCASSRPVAAVFGGAVLLRVGVQDALSSRIYLTPSAYATAYQKAASGRFPNHRICASASSTSAAPSSPAPTLVSRVAAKRQCRFSTKAGKAGSPEPAPKKSHVHLLGRAPAPCRPAVGRLP